MLLLAHSATSSTITLAVNCVLADVLPHSLTERGADTHTERVKTCATCKHGEER